MPKRKEIPLDGDILERAYTYGKARIKYIKVYEQMDTVDGLDEFDPKYVRWENRLYRAEQAKDKAKQELLDAAMEWSQDD